MEKSALDIHFPNLLMIAKQGLTGARTFIRIKQYSVNGHSYPWVLSGTKPNKNINIFEKPSKTHKCQTFHSLHIADIETKLWNSAYSSTNGKFMSFKDNFMFQKFAKVMIHSSKEQNTVASHDFTV